jgi:nicotinamidase-related amidase
MKVLLVIDMQNDFISGALGSPEAQAIVERVAAKIKDFDGQVWATRDTHEENYLSTAEGRKLPVAHCIRGTAGHEIHPEIQKLLTTPPIDKKTFGSTELGELLVSLHQEERIESITLVGVCTDICVISNALLAKAFLPEIPVLVDSSCCAGTSPESHKRALEAMAVCQIEIV